MYVLRRSELNAPQYDAVTHRDGPMLVLAGAGSGKTRVIAHRIAHMVSQRVEPESIVAVSFTNKAAAEMRERVSGLVGRELSSRCVVSTFHALGANILRRDIRRLGYRVPFAIFDTSDQKGVVRDLLKEMRLNGSRIDPDAILNTISKAKLAFTDPARLPGMRFNPQRAIMSKLHTRYNAALRAFNAVDFDDLINLPVRLFEEHPDVLERYHDEWRYLMVDEYQDTNHTQFVLLQQLAKATSNVVVVGDDDQSIYGFRGAISDHILSFEEHFPGAKVVSLEQNYRSTGIILKAANNVISKNTKRRDKVLWTDQERGEPIVHYTCRDEAEEATMVAENIARLRRERDISYGQIAILYRINPQSRAFEEALQDRAIPYRIVGGTKFYDRKEVRDVLHYLRVCHNPHDELAMRRIVNVPPRGAGHALVQQIGDAAIARRASVYTVLSQHLDTLEIPSARTRERLQHFAEVIKRYNARFRATGSLHTAARELIAEVNYLEHLRSGAGKEEMVRRRVDNVVELINALASWEARHSDANLSTFLERVALEPPSPDKEKNSDEVVMMTFHSSKGLEFPYVFMVGCDEGLLPHARSLTERGGIDEERRLCYVGITRAKQGLVITSCRTRMHHGEAQHTKPSRFLADVPEDTIVYSTQEGSGAAEELQTIQRSRDQLYLDQLRKAIFKD